MVKETSVANNHYFPTSFSTSHDYWIAILENHPLYRALTATADIAKVHLDSLWRTIRYVHSQVAIPNSDEEIDDEHPRMEPEHFEFQCYGSPDTIWADLELFRGIFLLPEVADAEILPSDGEMLESIRLLGYEGQLLSLKDFKKNRMPTRWYIIYSILNRCFTMTPSGTDTMTKPMLHMYYSFLFGIRVDWAEMLWNLVKIQVNKTVKSKRYIPCERFFALIIDQAIRFSANMIHPIPRLQNSPTLKLTAMTFVVIREPQGIVTAPIPTILVRQVPVNDERIRRYKASLQASQAPVQTEHDQPAEPEHHVQPVHQQARLARRTSQKRKAEEGTSRIQRAKPARPSVILRTQTTMPSPRISESETESDELSTPLVRRMRRRLNDQTPPGASGSLLSQPEVSPIMSQPSSPPPASQTPVPITRPSSPTSDENMADQFMNIPSDSSQTLSQSSSSNESSDNETNSENDSDSDDDVNEPTQTTPITMHKQKEKMITGRVKSVARKRRGQTFVNLPESEDNDGNDNTMTLLPDQGQGLLSRTAEGSPKSLVEGASRLSAGNPSVDQRQTVSEGEVDCDQEHNLSSTTGGHLDSLKLSDSRGSFDLTPEEKTQLVTLSGDDQDLILYSENVESSTNRESYSMTFGSPMNVGHRISISIPILVSPEIFNMISKMPPRAISRSATSLPLTETGLMSALGDTPRLTQSPGTRPRSSRSATSSPETGLASALGDTPRLIQSPGTRPRSSRSETSSHIITPPSPIFKTRLLTTSGDTPRGKHGGKSTAETPPMTGLRTASGDTPRLNVTPAELSFDEFEAQYLARLLSISNLDPLREGALKLIQTARSRLPPPTCKPVIVLSPDEHEDSDSESHHEGEIKRSRMEMEKKDADLSSPVSGGNQDNYESESEKDDELPILHSEMGVGDQEESLVGNEDDVDYDQVLKQSHSYVVEGKGKEKVGETSEDLELKHLLEEVDEFNETQYNNLQVIDEDFLRRVESEVMNNTDPSFPLQEKRDMRFNQGIFYKDRVNRLPLSNEQEWKVLRAPYLEEQAYRIFVEKEVPRPDQFKVLGACSFKTDKHIRTEYLMMRRKYMIKDSHNLELQCKYAIDFIEKITLIGDHRIFLPMFHVIRTDKRKYTFSEADFGRLKMTEVMYLYNYLRNLEVRHEPEVKAIEAVKRFMRESIKLVALEDFQMGLEAVKKKINLTVPYQNIYGLDEMKLLQVVFDPEGFVFLNSQSEKIFVRTEEFKKYSDGTLRFAKRYLRMKLRNTDDDEEKSILEIILSKINSRINLRKNLRMYEILHGFRKRRTFRGSNYYPSFPGDTRKSRIPTNVPPVTE